MEFNFVTNIESCYADIPSLLYYSHIPTAIIALIFGIFVYFNNKKLLSGRILFLIVTLFSAWSLFDLILWMGHDSRMIMFFWSVINLFEMLTSAGILYFSYSFLEKKDAPFIYKLIVGLILLPFILLIPTAYNLSGFDLIDCEAQQGAMTGYFYAVEIIFFVWLSGFLVWSLKKSKEIKQAILISVGSVFFLVSFSGANIIGSATENWKILQYGLFGMPVFIGLLSYLIVKFKAFNVRLIETEALVAALIILIASEFAFVKNPINLILTGVTLLLAMIFGAMLVRSVKSEVQRKEELQMMSDKLSLANAELIKLDNAKAEFISIASHQLRTPLTAIKGFISLLLEGSYGKLAPKQEVALNKAYLSNNRLIALVEDLLNVSRIESGKMDFKFDQWSLEKLCREVVDMFVLRAKDNKLGLEFQSPEKPLPEVTIDGPKVREVISNLVDNAIKYTPKGGVRIRLEQDETNVRVIVADTGIGIPASERPYLFAKFSRGKDISRLNTGGTGLGLYVGKNIIESNGGKIWAESDGEGKGSMFIIQLPRKQSPEILERWG